jgi:hypothetical protein
MNKELYHLHFILAILATLYRTTVIVLPVTSVDTTYTKSASQSVVCVSSSMIRSGDMFKLGAPGGVEEGLPAPPH